MSKLKEELERFKPESESELKEHFEGLAKAFSFMVVISRCLITKKSDIKFLFAQSSSIAIMRETRKICPKTRLCIIVMGTMSKAKCLISQ